MSEKSITLERLQQRLEKLKGSKPIVSYLKDTKRHPAWKQWQGRVLEIKFLIKECERR